MFKFVYTLDKSLHRSRNVLIKDIKKCLGSRCKGIDHIVSCLINNSIDTVLRGNDKVYISLNKNTYNYIIENGIRVNIPFSYKCFILVLSAMESLGYIKVEKGGRVYKYDHKSKLTTGNGLIVDSVTYSYAVLLDKFKNILPDTIDIKFRKIDNVITLRDMDKVNLEFSMPKHIKVKKKSLDSYNISARNSNIRDNKGFSYDCQIRKIFNSSFKVGGRSYMSEQGIQSLTKEERMTLTIDDRDTVIYDFVAFETTIAYTLAGIKLEGDPYSKYILDGYPDELSRDINKMMLNVLFNVTEDDDVAGIVGYHLSQKYDIDKLYKDGLIPDPVIPLRNLLIRYEDAYDEIYDFFYCGSENELSRIGSEIMDYIIDFFNQRGDIVLPVFDEVICPEGLEDELLVAMRLGWKHVLGTEMNFNIRKEK